MLNHRRCWIIAGLWIGLLATVFADEPVRFITAKPVWPKGRETEMNVTTGFRAVFEAPADRQQKVVLRVAAASIYRAWLNGEFLGCGPARGPHGFYRVDEWDLTAKLNPGKNVAAIEVAGYNCNSYYLLDQPSFCQAEIMSGQQVLASTAGEGVPFAAGALDYRLQKVQRYSFQRPFIEVYVLRPGWDRWFRDIEVPPSALAPDIEKDRAELRRQLKSVLEEVAKPHENKIMPRAADQPPADGKTSEARESTGSPARSTEKEDRSGERPPSEPPGGALAPLRREVEAARAESAASQEKADRLQRELDALDRDIQAVRAQNEQMQRQVEAYRAQIELRRGGRYAPALWTPADCAVQPPKTLLARRVPYPEFNLKQPATVVSVGRVERREKVENVWKDRSLVNVGPKLKGFPESQLDVIPSIDMQHWATTAKTPRNEPWTALSLAEREFAIVDFGANLSGSLGAKWTCSKPSRIALAFDEILTDGDVDFKRLGCVNMVTYYVQPGEYRVETIEPYTMRYLKLLCLEGACRIDGVYLREYAHPEPRAARFHASDERLNRLFAAGVLTFRQNALDIFMDCPSRERAGWLCDSFFTARVAADLAGSAAIERNFFQNYALPERFAHLPDGMLPMCYPADHNDGIYIPNWALWFVVQLEEYAARSGDQAAVEALRPKVLRLLEFLKQYENSDGLLEKLPSWVFIEWSRANDFVQDVNYPSNMLYAGALSAASRLYNAPELAAKAERIRETVRKQSFDGQFFVDNAVRREGKLQVTRNRSEVCQYFAFFFDVANRNTHAELWRVLRDEFGPHRAKTKAHADIHPANSFIGNMLRMELLSRADRGQQILDESVAYLLYMADRTGTLWEHVGANASCNHGFASHIVHTLYRDILGLRRVETVSRRITIRFQDVNLAACEGSIPTPDGPVSLRWNAEGDRLRYALKHPAGYQATIENVSGKQLEAELGSP